VDPTADVVIDDPSFPSIPGSDCPCLPNDDRDTVRGCGSHRRAFAGRAAFVRRPVRCGIPCPVGTSPAHRERPRNASNRSNSDSIRWLAPRNRVRERDLYRRPIHLPSSRPLHQNEGLPRIPTTTRTTTTNNDNNDNNNNDNDNNNNNNNNKKGGHK